MWPAMSICHREPDCLWLNVTSIHNLLSITMRTRHRQRVRSTQAVPLAEFPCRAYASLFRFLFEGAHCVSASGEECIRWFWRRQHLQQGKEEDGCVKMGIDNSAYKKQRERLLMMLNTGVRNPRGIRVGLITIKYNKGKIPS